MTEMSTPQNTTPESKPTGSFPWYVASAVAIGVSVDTSWRFFGENLHITDLRERIILFAVLEITMVAAGWSMRAGVRRNGHPGSARLVAWALCGFSAYMAMELSGPAEGLARVALGPVLALVALHQALGIEIKARMGVRSGVLARIGRELRERALSRLGLADDSRDALQRTQERAAVRAATIATSAKPSRRALRKAVLKAGPAQRALILETAGALRNLDSLVSANAALDNPWVAKVDKAVDKARPTSGGPAISWDLDKVVAMELAGQDVTGLVSPKNLQRVRRVLRALAADMVVAEFGKGDLTAQFIQRVTAARLKAMEA
jgi:hypothetical protein